ncbi:helix-turn-helix domain-containing protein [Enterococcus sp. HY326]|uniref:helix-turn-helix domain-containing protein n=1 Tax=Enterococcus sp. HY326 TaxID=2971265 RepID=UPI002240D1DE|nr:helix-turn-helix transcriptional regulator [Enterococcus sp. HY326]
MKLGDKINTFRTLNNLSQSELSEIIGVGEKEISDWELGNVYPTIHQIEELSVAFRIPLFELLLDDLGDIELIVYRTPLRQCYWIAFFSGVISIFTMAILYHRVGLWALYLSVGCLIIHLFSLFKLITYKGSKLLQTYGAILSYVNNNGISVEENPFLKKSEKITFADIILLLITAISTGLFIGIVYSMFTYSP